MGCFESKTDPTNSPSTKNNSEDELAAIGSNQDTVSTHMKLYIQKGDNTIVSQSWKDHKCLGDPIRSKKYCH